VSQKWNSGKYQLLPACKRTISTKEKKLTRDDNKTEIAIRKVKGGLMSRVSEGPVL
jgi:hypothetical protein